MLWKQIKEEEEPMYWSPRKLFITNVYKYKRKPLCCNVLRPNQHRGTATDAVEKGQKLRILFFGTDNFSLPSLEALHRTKNERCTDSLSVVTSFKNPANCVRLYAEQNLLPLHRWPVVPEICRQYDLGVVVSFGHLIPTNVINSFPLGMINVHASLLPRWRGAAPIIYALMHGDRTTGVSIMKIEPKHFDVGDILAQEIVPIKENTFMSALHSELAQRGANLLVRVLDDFPSSFQTAQKQNNTEATYAPKIIPAITEVNWKQTADQIYRLYRSLHGFKNVCTRFQDKSLQFVEMKLPVGSSLKTPSLPGSVLYNRERNCLLVRCSGDTEIEVHQLRMEGKKVMRAIDFNNGFLKKLKTPMLSFECTSANN